MVKKLILNATWGTKINFRINKQRKSFNPYFFSGIQDTLLQIIKNYKHSAFSHGV